MLSTWRPVALLLTAALPALTPLPASAVTITVTTADDQDLADGFCSLREAILAANTDAARNECPAGAGEDRIAFALTLPAVLQLGQDLPLVTASLAIRGPAAADLTIDGMDLFRLFVFDTPGGGGIFVLEDLMLTRGRAPGGTLADGGALAVMPGERVFVERVVFQSNSSLNGGGALVVTGSADGATRVEIRSSTFAGNRALGIAGGGAIRVQSAELYLAACALTANAAEDPLGSGGALYAERGTLEIERSTVAGNTADWHGGGMAVRSYSGTSALRMVDSTITGNRSDADASGNGSGGGLDAYAAAGLTVELRLVNNIIAENQDTPTPFAPDLSVDPGSATLLTTGWNLIGKNLGSTALFPAGNPDAQGDFVGTAAAPIDPRLETLGNHGGPTATRRPLLEATSPVIDHGHCPDAATDQRGWGDPGHAGRIFDNPTVEPNGTTSDGCDIGAVERGASANAASAIFASDFELPTLLLWSAAQP